MCRAFQPLILRTIAVIVPAHDESASIAACLASLKVAAAHPTVAGLRIDVVVVLDSCSDDTGEIAKRCGAQTVTVSARNVGQARAAGAALALSQGAEWLCFTDADTTVAEDWIATHIGVGGDAVCGTVTVDDWGGWIEGTRQRYNKAYRDVDGHRHVHGANLGVSAAAYRSTGGFPPLATGEDVALVAALEAQGAAIVWSAAPRVITSARRAFKCSGGFGAELLRLERLTSLCPVGAAAGAQ